MTTIERMHEDVAQDIAVTIVDTDVHPLPVSGEVLKSYAPAEWKDKLWPTGNAVSPVPHFYDTPDSYKTNSLRVDASPPRGGVAGSDPDFAAKQLLVDAGVSIAVLEPMCDAQLPQAEHILKATHNDWLADVWLGDNNWHGRWRGAISVTAQDPHAAAREIERWAGHPYMAEVLMTPQTRGIPFGSPHFDPMYEAAARNGFPVATHLMGQTPFELIPIYPVGNPAHWHDFFASWPLLYVSHLMSLVFDGAFDRHPESAGGVRGGWLHLGDAGDVAHGPDLGAAQGRSAARAAQAVRLRARACAVHHPTAGGSQRRASTGSTSR